MGIIGIALFIIVGLASFVCWIMVLIKLFKAKGILHGILGIFCSIYPFIWGFIHHRTQELTKVMYTWGAVTVLQVLFSMGFSVMAPAPGPETAKVSVKKTSAAVKKESPETAKAEAAGKVEKKAPAEVEISAEILRFGVYEGKTGETVKAAEKPAGMDGGDEIRVLSYRHLVETEKIQAKIGTLFGFEYVLRGTPPGKSVTLKMKDILHPLRKSDAKGPDRAFESVVRETAKIGEPKLVAFQFDQEEDLFNGTWTFQILQGDSLLAEKTFLLEVEQPKQRLNPVPPGQAQDGSPDAAPDAPTEAPADAPTEAPAEAPPAEAPTGMPEGGA